MVTISTGTPGIITQVNTGIDDFLCNVKGSSIPHIWSLSTVILFEETNCKNYKVEITVLYFKSLDNVGIYDQDIFI